MSQAQHDHQMFRMREAEDAFERAYLGQATEQDWEHLAWEIGILSHYKRISTKEREHEMG